MKRKRRHGRLFLLTCLGFAVLQGPLVAQTPTSGAAVAPTPPASQAPSSPPVVSTPAREPAAPPAAKAAPTPSSADEGKAAVTTTPSAKAAPLIPGRLDYSSESPRRDPESWQKTGAVGQSTFMDKLRTMAWALALICFLVWLIGKFAPKGTLEKFGLPATESDSLIELLEKKRMSPGRSILLLRVGPKVLAIAATESGYTTLAEIDGEAVKKHLDEKAEQAPPPAAPVAMSGPSDVAKHYLSIIPGLGAKK